MIDISTFFPRYAIESANNIFASTFVTIFPSKDGSCWWKTTSSHNAWFRKRYTKVCPDIRVTIPLQNHPSERFGSLFRCTRQNRTNVTIHIWVKQHLQPVEQSSFHILISRRFAPLSGGSRSTFVSLWIG